MLKLTKIVWTMLLCLLLAGCVNSVDNALPYDQLPEVIVATPVRLVASPNHPTSYLSQNIISAGAKAQLLGNDTSAAWLLVRHKGILGWMPSIFSRTNVATFPMAVTVDAVPSDCTYLNSIFGLEEIWTSTVTDEAIVVGSLYRPTVDAEFAEATLQLKINGGGYALEADYVHLPLTADDALILFGFSVAKLKEDSTLSFVLTDAGDEPLDFVASIFSGECQKDRLIDQLPIGQTKTITESVIAGLDGKPNRSVENTIVVTNTRPRPTPLPAGSRELEPEGEVRPLGALWEKDGVALNLVRLEIRTENDIEDAALRAWLVLFNNTGQRLLVEINWNNIYFEDSFGTEYVDWDGGGLTSHWVEPGNSYSFDRYYTVSPGNRSRIPANTEYVQAVVTKLSRVTNARWRFDINPILTPLTLEEFAEVREVDETWDVEGLQLTVTDAEIRASSDLEDAAARVSFTLENLTNYQILVELDFGRIYLTDSFGRRFNDWDAGGFWSFSLEPGQSRSFDRYYAEMSGMRSRITRGSEFVVIQGFKVGRIPRAAWYVPIVR